MAAWTRVAQALAFCILTLVSGHASAQAPAELYRFEWGPHPAGAANPGACTDAAQPWYSTPEAACQGTKAVHPNCDRASAVYRNHVATLLPNRTQCYVTWEFQNIGGGGWGSWSATPGVSFCSTDPRCAKNIEISLAGAGSTKALPAGPALPQIARVTSNGAPAAGKSVTITLVAGGALSGTTDGAGEFRFAYVPPYQRATQEQLTATCSDCNNTAQKTITVVQCDICERPVGNPIQPGSGEKQESASDWIDAAPHPLSLTRHYRSAGNVDSGLGGHWSHNFAGSAVPGDTEAVVRLGDGSKVLFQRIGGVWQSDNRRDSLSADAAGVLYTRASDETRYQFDAAGRLESIAQRNGWAMSLAYSAGGQLTSVTNAFGRSLQFSYSGSRITGITTSDGTIAYGYDAAARLASVTHPDGAARSYHYEDARWPLALTGITNEAGQRFASFSYDAAGRATGSQHAGGAQSYNISYADPGNPTGSLMAGNTVDPSIYRATAQVTDPLGNSRTVVYQGGDGQVRLLGASSALEGNQIANRTFVGSMLPESETDFLGVQTLYTWDLSRQLKLATTEAAGRAEGRTTQTQWHPDFRLPVLVTETGRSTTYSYDSLGNKLSETISDTATGEARTWQWTYNDKSLADTMTEPKGGIWHYGYDNAGNRTSSSNPLGQQTSYTYDAAGRVLSQAEPNGLVTSYTYDARGRLIAQNRGGEVSSFNYTPTGQLAGATLPNGLQVSYSYDAAQRLVAASDNRGNSINYTLDAMGNRVREEVKDATGAVALVTGRVINSLNKVEAIQGSVGQTTALAYDANGEPIAQTDPLNQTTRQTLDRLRRPTATTFPDNTSASQAWNQLDQLTQVIDPKGVQTSYQTNAFGEVTSESSPDIGTMAYSRDASGDVVAVQDAKGSTSAITRDALGRPIEIRHAPDHIAFFSYDQGQAGYLNQIEDKSGSTSYQRDAPGQGHHQDPVRQRQPPQPDPAEGQLRLPGR